MIEPGNGMQFSSSVKHLHNMHLSAQSPQIRLGWTIDGRSKKGRFKHTLYFSFPRKMVERGRMFARGSIR